MGKLPVGVMRLTKYRAAHIQIDAAIKHFREGRWVEAITLAGAAEYCLPAIEGRGLKALIKKNQERMSEPAYAKRTTDMGIKSDKDVIRVVNSARNWLKHWNKDQPDEWIVEPEEALFMIFRAVSVYEHHVKKSSRQIRWFHTFARRYLKTLAKQ